MEFIRKENAIYLFDLDKEVGRITFILENNTLLVTHTIVSAEYRGQGIALKLVTELIGFAEENNFKISPICSYVVSWFEKNPAYQYLLVK